MVKIHCFEDRIEELASIPPGEQNVHELDSITSKVQTICEGLKSSGITASKKCGSLISVIQQCLQPLSRRPDASAVCAMLKKICEVALLVDRAKR